MNILYEFHEHIEALRQFPAYLPHLAIATVIVAVIAVFVWLSPSKTVEVMSDEEAHALVKEQLAEYNRKRDSTEVDAQTGNDKPSRPRRKEVPTVRPGGDMFISNPLHPASPLNAAHSSGSTSSSASSSSSGGSDASSGGGSFD